MSNAIIKKRSAITPARQINPKAEFISEPASADQVLLHIVAQLQTYSFADDQVPTPLNRDSIARHISTIPKWRPSDDSWRWQSSLLLLCGISWITSKE
jgi:hypothetical protein